MFSHPFLRKLDGLHQVPLLYNDEETRVLAESLVPLKSLEEKAKAKCQSSNDSRELLLLELLRWFKHDFFSWTDQPLCDICKTKTQQRNMGTPTTEEKMSLAQRVELYWCESCQKEIRFPRYNCPRKLLETRTGRCGEWANCFTLICLAVGFEARYIYDVTDHVWTEVWSDSQNKWLHCDPCEGVCDTPLIYEQGWGKKLSYIIALSTYEVSDVTWRYVTNYVDALKRRIQVPENLLIKYQDVRTKQYQSTLDETTKHELAVRRVKELTDFLVPPKVRGSGDTQGRTSGDLAWRLSRKETNASRVISNRLHDIAILRFTYSAAKDMYTIDENGQTVETVTGWGKMMFSQFNIHRKEEHDWKMAYIARHPGSDLGQFQYQFELSRLCRHLTIRFKRETYENGRVLVTVFADDQTICVRNNDCVPVALSGARRISVVCELTNGQGNVAWQHAQAFRQSLDDNQPALEIELYF